MNRTTSLATLALLLAFYGTATAQTTRGFVAINGGLQSGSKGFSQDSLVNSPLFGPEDGTLTARHPGGNATVFDVAAGARLWRQLGVGVGVSRLSRSETVGLSGQLPHPFRFDRPRAVDGTEAGVARGETAIHVYARWGIPVSQSVEVALFGGPTFFSVSQAFVGVPAVRAASRVIVENFPPVARVADVSDGEQFEDLSDIPDADIARMKEIRDAARQKNKQTNLEE